LADTTSVNATRDASLVGFGLAARVHAARSAGAARFRDRPRAASENRTPDNLIASPGDAVSDDVD
jgi:hypothetical protein